MDYKLLVNLLTQIFLLPFTSSKGYSETFLIGIRILTVKPTHPNTLAIRRLPAEVKFTSGMGQVGGIVAGMEGGGVGMRVASQSYLVREELFILGLSPVRS